MEPEIRVFRLGDSWLSDARRRHPVGAAMAAILIFCGLMLQLAPAAVRRPSILALVVVGVFTAVASPPNAR